MQDTPDYLSRNACWLVHLGDSFKTDRCVQSLTKKKLPHIILTERKSELKQFFRKYLFIDTTKNK